MSPRSFAYGEEGTYVDLGLEGSPDRARRTLAAVARHRAAFPNADVVAGAGVLVVVKASPGEVRALDVATELAAVPTSGREHSLRVAYDGEDLAEVAELLGVSPAEVIHRHTSAAFTAEILGFLPGFAYLSPVDPAAYRLTVPRRASPRKSVPRGSVAIAASFSGIYPFASPGGWRLLGRLAGASVFDPRRDPPELFAAGDRVRFVAVEPGEAGRPDVGTGSFEDRPDVGTVGVPALRVVRAPACATVQDRGRQGILGRGYPPSGPLDPETFAAAASAVGNGDDAAAIEIPLGSLEVEARGSLVLSLDGEPARTLSDGERFVVPTSGRAVRYLAIRGGLEVPTFLGSRSTLVPARLGGFLGRPLRRGDLLGIGEAFGSTGRSPPDVSQADPDAPLGILPGPHLDRFPSGALDALLAGDWQVSRLSDRVGVRLEGPRIPRDQPDLGAPVPMIRGAVEITSDGTPIILGPDHPTTGGYPVLAVLTREAQASLARLGPGRSLRFRCV